MSFRPNLHCNLAYHRRYDWCEWMSAKRWEKETLEFPSDETRLWEEIGRLIGRFWTTKG